MDLLSFKKDVTSQFGEDGVLEKVFEVLGIKKGQCVEFGAWDGKQYSNTYNLIANRQWGGVLIEGSKERFSQLKETYRGRNDVKTLNCLVGFEPPDSLDDILAKTALPIDFELLSIDIDGNDYHIFSSVNKYHPKVVVVEFNYSIPNHIGFIQERNMAVYQGSSLNALCKLASTKGYELVCATDTNGIFVDRKYFPLFGITDNSIDALHKEVRYHTYLLQLFDGTLLVAGVTRMLWHGVTIESSRMQVLPPELRKYPDRIK
jgi:hypothetical protein